MEWALVIVALATLAVAGVSRWLSGTPVTPAMVFVAIGVLVGSEVLGEVTPSPTGSTVRVLAEATLALVLFSDASRIRLPALRRHAAVPLRLLGIGLPLTIALGALAAFAVFDRMTVFEALLLAVLLAPTDAALGQAVVTEPRLPSRIRQGLNVESGLNDGICVPLLFIVLAAAEAESHVTSDHHALTIVFEEIGYGLLGGVGAGLLVVAIVRLAGRRGLIAESWMPAIPVAGAALAYGSAAALGGSGFIAAFVAGGVFGVLLGNPSEVTRLTDEVGELLGGATFLIFGAVLLGPALGELTWRVVLYALISLTLVRMLPVAIAMLGTHARPPTVAFLGWFGPRGLASIVFALIVVEESQLPEVQTILVATYLTVGLSVFAHGVSAAPFADRYARWYEAHPRGSRPPMESGPTDVHRPRGPIARSVSTGQAEAADSGSSR